MASTVKVRVVGGINGPRVQAQLVLLGAGGETIVLPITSPQATYANLEANWQEVPRPGLKPINQRVGEKLRTAQYTVTIVGGDNGPWDGSNTVEPIIDKLAAMCQAEGAQRPIAMVWGKFDSSTNLTGSGHWHIDTMQITSTWRQPVTNNVSQATATITLKEASDLPTTGFAQSPGATSGTVATQTPKKAKQTTYTVKSGDTIYSISQKMYGNDDTASWKKILTANKISDPRKLKVGQVLIIP